MRKLSSREAVDNLLRVLVNSGKNVYSEKWQALPIVRTTSQNPILQRQASLEFENQMIEVCNLFLTMNMIEDPSNLAELVGADLPWAEDHFQERIAGSSNPGEQYKNWPYWKVDDKFMLPESGEFSHTYQERFWPNFTGNRYDAGTWEDVKDRLADDTSTRQAFLAIWNPEDQSNNGVRVPCTIGYWFKVRDGFLDVTYLIRSCDARRHLRNDIYMTQRLAHEMLDHLRKEGRCLDLGSLSMWIGSLHCFHSDMYEIKKQIK
jgi:hypothetical protein